MTQRTEIMYDPMLGHHTLFAPARSDRPIVLQERPDQPTDDEPCPFCQENEHLTPPATMTLAADAIIPESQTESSSSQRSSPPCDDCQHQRSEHQRSATPWQVKVVPNLYPALDQSHPDWPHSGLHEVVIHTPDHRTQPTELAPWEWVAIYQTYRERARQLAENRALGHLVIFQNSGAAAGASLPHLHSQFLGLPYVPEQVTRRLEFCETFFQQHHCPYYDALLAGAGDGSGQHNRLVYRGEHWAAFCPRASRFAYETWLIPTEGATTLQQATDGQIQEIAHITSQLLEALDSIIPTAPFNMIVQNRPFPDRQQGDNHSSEVQSVNYPWHVELLPRTATWGGLECGLSDFINPVLPNQAAAELREAFPIRKAR